MVLMIDNYDSFTYNLVRYFEELGEEVVTRRCDALTVPEVASMAPSHIVISPWAEDSGGGGRFAGGYQHYAGVYPMLGVCLGHQAIGVSLGARLVRAERLVHGKVSSVYHDGTGSSAGSPPLSASPGIIR